MPDYDDVPVVTEAEVQFGFLGGLAAAMTWMAVTKVWNAVVNDRLKMRELDLKTSWTLFTIIGTVVAICFHDNERVLQVQIDSLKHSLKAAERSLRS